MEQTPDDTHGAPRPLPWTALFLTCALIEGAAAIVSGRHGDTVNAICFAFASGLLTCALMERMAGKGP